MRALLPEGFTSCNLSVHSKLIAAGLYFFGNFFYLINSKYKKVLKVFDNSLQNCLKSKLIKTRIK